jgi:hypothetical protein
MAHQGQDVDKSRLKSGLPALIPVFLSATPVLYSFFRFQSLPSHSFNWLAAISTSASFVTPAVIKRKGLIHIPHYSHFPDLPGFGSPPESGALSSAPPAAFNQVIHPGVSHNLGDPVRLIFRFQQLPLWLFDPGQVVIISLSDFPSPSSAWSIHQITIHVVRAYPVDSPCPGNRPCE